MTTNRAAFLTMLAISEGTQNIGDQLGYNVLVGSTPQHGVFFRSYADHPRMVIKIGDESSSAAGRYQILARTFDFYKKSLNLPDFSPSSQDAIALEIIKERGALPNIDSGDLAGAIARCKNIWASLPGSPYGQHTQTIEFLTQAFLENGGTLSPPSGEPADDSAVA